MICKQHVEDVGVGLLDFVEQHHGVGPAADLLGQLAAFLEADVARRGADQPADVVLLHVLAHVDLDQGVLVAEHELGQGLGQQGLAHAGGAGEDEAAGGPLGVLQAAAAAADGLGDRLDRLVLADDRACAARLPSSSAASSLRCVMRVSGTPVIFETTSAITSSSTTPSVSRDFSRHSRVISLLLLLELVGLVAQGGGLLEVLVGDRLFLLLVELLDLARRSPSGRAAGSSTFRRTRAPGLVDHVDGLVRQAAAGDVAARTARRPPPRRRR